MKIRLLLALLLAATTVFIISSCEKEDDDDDIEISENGDDDSHNMGQNCMNCHTNGPGEGVFKIAGTVYDTALVNPNPNSRVEFYDAPTGGNLKYTLEIDANGNFYSSEHFDFGTGLYPKVISASGQSRSMNSPFTGGGCASCHGNTRPRIGV